MASSQAKSAARNDFMIRAIAAWSCVPELRFGQFLDNVRADEFPLFPDMFFIEDIKLIEAMEKWVTQHTEGAFNG